MSISVSGNLKDIATGAVVTGSWVRFVMRGTAGNQPFVAGTALLAPAGASTWFKDFTPDNTGTISGNLYSKSEVSVGGQTGVISYGMQIFVNSGVTGPEVLVDASQNININNPNLLGVLPVVVAPTGDSTYARLDGGNTPFTGAISAKSINNVLSAAQYAGVDIGAQINAAIAALPAAGGIIDARGFIGSYTLTTTITDQSKPVRLLFGATTITSNVTAVSFATRGSRVEGSGYQTIFAAGASLPVSSGLIVFNTPGTNLQNVYCGNLQLQNNRHSRTGLIRFIQTIQGLVEGITLNSPSFWTHGVEFIDGFANTLRNSSNYASAGGVFCGIQANTLNASNNKVEDLSVFAMTAVDINYCTGNVVTLVDTTYIENISLSYSTGPVAKFAKSTLASGPSAGATSITVQAGAGASFTANYPVRIGSGASNTKSELNVITSIVGDTLNLRFPLYTGHGSGERVLGGQVGYYIGPNTILTTLTTGHVEGVGVGIDIQNGTDILIQNYSIANGVAEGSIIGDGIRFDAALRAAVIGSTFNGLTNALNFTTTQGAWLSATAGVYCWNLNDGGNNTNFIQANAQNLAGLGNSGFDTPGMDALVTPGGLGNNNVQLTATGTGSIVASSPFRFLNKVTLYNNGNTVGNGVPSELGQIHLTAQVADVSQTLLSFPAAGFYRISVCIAVTRVATSTSTLPPISVQWYDSDGATFISQTIGSALTGNALTTFQQGTLYVHASNGGNITVSTSGYASSGATAMQFAIGATAEAL